jgi:hypothetical protein
MRNEKNRFPNIQGFFRDLNQLLINFEDITKAYHRHNLTFLIVLLLLRVRTTTTTSSSSTSTTIIISLLAMIRQKGEGKAAANICYKTVKNNMI